MSFIKTSEHVFICGFTGSGKSYLAKKYLEFPLQHTFMLDIKDDLNSWGKDVITVNSIASLSSLNITKYKKPTKFRIVPDITELNFESYDEFFKFCYYLQNCTIYVDEVTAICPNPQKIPFHYMSILTRGRSRNTNVFSLTQRPKNIPMQILSESTHYFVFRLNLEQDRERIVEATGQDKFLNPLTKQYSFYYYNQLSGLFTEAILR
jgi:hypothetical protein